MQQRHRLRGRFWASLGLSLGLIFAVGCVEEEGEPGGGGAADAHEGELGGDDLGGADMQQPAQDSGQTGEEDGGALPPACPELELEDVHYISEDPLQCAAMLFSCEAGEPFFSDCGCGCVGGAAQLACPEQLEEDVHYISEDPLQCAAMLFSCEEGAELFFSDCGCGCIGGGLAQPECGEGEIPVEGRCEQLCYSDDGCSDDMHCNVNEVCLNDPSCPMCDVCVGWCVGDEPIVCPEHEREDVTYVSEDPLECAAILFSCGEDGELFFSDCGCGCIGGSMVQPECGEGEVWAEGRCEPLCYGDETCGEGERCNASEVCLGDPSCPMCAVCVGWCVDAALDCPEREREGVRYVGHSVEECSVMRFVCEAGEEMFSSECGCGCVRAQAPECDEGEIAVEGRCERLCYGDDGCGQGERCNASEVCMGDPSCPMCDVCAGWCVEPRFETP